MSRATFFACAKTKFLPDAKYLVAGETALKRQLTVILKYVANRRQPDFMLFGMIEKLEDQERWVALAEYWLAVPESIFIRGRLKAYGREAELERHERCVKALNRYHRNACYFLGAFQKRNSIATAYFVLEMDQALLDLDRFLFAAHDLFVAERKSGPESDSFVERSEKKKLRDDSIEHSAREFLDTGSVQSVRLMADIARYVHLNCVAAKALKLPTIITILRSRGIKRN